MPGRLKVFTWSDGFHAFTVAAASRPKALQAWGVSQDLFKTGLAHEIPAGADYEAALKSPGKVIETGLSVDVGKMAPARRAKKKSATANAAARRKVDTLRQRLEALDDDHAAKVETLQQRVEEARAALDAAQSAHAVERRRLEKQLSAARDRL